MMGDMEIRSKLWLEIDGKPVFGRGRRFLLEAIDKYGSINQAARGINISYRKAWDTSRRWKKDLVLNLSRGRPAGKTVGARPLKKTQEIF